MTDYDRKVYKLGWRKTPLQATVDVEGKIEIDKGDLVFLDRVNGLRDRGSSVANYKGYPFSKISGATLSLASRQTLAYQNFLGVAAWHSESGVTEQIAVHINGLFNYPLKNASHTKVGYYVIPAGSGVTLYNQAVTISSSGTSRIGMVADSGEFRSSVNVVLWTIFNTLIGRL